MSVFIYIYVNNLDSRGIQQTAYVPAMVLLHGQDSKPSRASVHSHHIFVGRDWRREGRSYGLFLLFQSCSGGHVPFPGSFSQELVFTSTLIYTFIMALAVWQWAKWCRMRREWEKEEGSHEELVVGGKWGKVRCPLASITKATYFQSDRTVTSSSIFGGEAILYSFFFFFPLTAQITDIQSWGNTGKSACLQSYPESDVKINTNFISVLKQYSAVEEKHGVSSRFASRNFSMSEV